MKMSERSWFFLRNKSFLVVQDDSSVTTMKNVLSVAAPFSLQANQFRCCCRESCHICFLFCSGSGPSSVKNAPVWFVVLVCLKICLSKRSHTDIFCVILHYFLPVFLNGAISKCELHKAHKHRHTKQQTFPSTGMKW